MMAGDCILMAFGDTHKLVVTEPTKSLYLTDDGSQVVQHYTKDMPSTKYIHPDHRWYANTGSFVKGQEIGVDSYVSRAGYDPTELGYVVANVKKGRMVEVKPQIVGEIKD